VREWINEMVSKREIKNDALTLTVLGVWMGEET